jgi:Flp pilus assembly protein TadG
MIPTTILRRFCKPAFGRRARQGVTTIEGVLVLSTLLLVMFVLFDFGLAAFQYNTLSMAARYLARTATVHGSAAPPQHTTWGPTAYAGTAGDNSEIGNTVLPLLATMSGSSVAINMTWPDGSNGLYDTVQVQLKYTHKCLVPFLPGISTINMQAESTMPMCH